MAIDFSRMLLQPTQATPWNLSGGGDSSAREQLKLMRKKFEYEKKRNEEEDRIEREKAAAAAAAAKLAAEAEKAAKLQESRSALFTEFTKQSGEGNAEAMRAMVPQLHALGMDIELEGEEGGLPRYRVGMDAAAQQQAEGEQLAQTSPYGEGETAEQSLSRIGAMGLGGETGSLLPPLGIRASGEVDPATGRSVADRVAATYGMPGEKTATRGPDTEDFTGGVPKNVIDMGASAAATLHRLDPALKGMVAAYPDEQTAAGAEAIRQGLRGSGLPLEKQMAAFEKGISGPASQRNAQIGAQAQADRFREQRDQLTPIQADQLQKSGSDELESLFKERKIDAAVNSLNKAIEVEQVLNDPNRENDSMVANAVMEAQNLKGAPSNTDLEFAFGIPKGSWLTRGFAAMEEAIKGGMSDAQKRAVLSYMQAVKDTAGRNVDDYFGSAYSRLDAGDMHAEKAKTFKARLESSVPAHLYNDYWERREEREKGKKGAAKTSPATKGGHFDPDPIQGDFDIELESLAMESDLDPEKIKAVMGPESGGKANARNAQSGATGLIQFLPSIARDLGTSTEELAQMSASEQLPFVMKYFSDRGVTSDSPAEDYVLAVAAPAFIGKSPETVVYRKGSKEWEQNPAWRPPGGGDITVASIQRFYGGSKGKSASSAAAAPKSSLDKSVLDILRRAAD